MTKLKLVPFDTSVTYKGIKSFNCDNEMINLFVHKSLKKRVKRHLSQAYVLLDEKENFVGFYTLDTFSISREILKFTHQSDGLPPVVPAVKLGMLGVAKHLQKQGIGKRLLRDAFVKVAEISRIAGCTGIYLLAEEKAIPFYEKLGFIALHQNKPVGMFLHIAKILESLNDR